MKFFLKFFFIQLFFIFSFGYAQIGNVSAFELNSIEFRGNDFASSRTLRGVIASKESPFWFWKFLNSFTNLGKEPVYFDSSLISRDVKLLQAFYQDNGFFQAKVSAQYEIDSMDQSAKIIFDIEENNRCIVNSINYPGLETKVSPHLFSLMMDEIKIKKWDKFSRDALENDLNRIVDILKNFGYMLAERQQVIVKIDTLNKMVDITAYIEPGNYYEIKKVRIDKKGPGKASVEDDLIYDLVKIKSGDRYDLSEINQAQLRLYRTGLFSSALINSVISDTVANKVPLNVSTDIGLINELSPELLVNNQFSTFNIGIGLNYTRKNFFGRARRLSVNGTLLTQDFYNINLSNVFGRVGLKDSTVLGIAGLTAGIEQPYLFNRSIIGRLEVYGTAEQKKYYRFFTLGAKVGLDFELPSYTFFNGIKTYLAYEREDRIIKPDFLRELVIALLISLNIQLPVGEDLDKYVDDVLTNGIRESNSIIGLELFANHADDVFFPTKGYNLQVNFENAGLFPYIKNLFSTVKDPSVQYYKVNLAASIYTNPWKPYPGAVAYKFRIGYMQKFGGKKPISQNRNFFSGGSNSIRGWRAKGLGPVFTFYDQNNQPITITEIGGSFILEGSIESRHKFTENLGGVVFIDYGNTWEDYKSTSWKNIAVATGFGFRYYTSFAPFRVDIGFEFYDPYSQKFIFKKKFFSSFQLHFGIGEAF